MGPNIEGRKRLSILLSLQETCTFYNNRQLMKQMSKERDVRVQAIKCACHQQEWLETLENEIENLRYTFEKN